MTSSIKTFPKLTSGASSLDPIQPCQQLRQVFGKMGLGNAHVVRRVSTKVHGNGKASFVDIERNGNTRSTGSFDRSSRNETWKKRRRRGQVGVSFLLALQHAVMKGRRYQNQIIFVAGSVFVLTFIAFGSGKSSRRSNDKQTVGPPISVRHDQPSHFSKHEGGHRVRTDPSNMKLDTLPERTLQKQKHPDFSIVFPDAQKHGKSLILPTVLDAIERSDSGVIDFGDLDIDIFIEDSARRYIHLDYSAQESRYLNLDEPLDDDYDMYYAFDDDYNRNTVMSEWIEEYIKDDVHCRRTSEHRTNSQNCNLFHETEPIESNLKFLGEGGYREVFSLQHRFHREAEKVVVKDIRFALDAHYDNFEFTRMDAMVAEKLTVSPRIYDIYGFCGLGIISEFFPHGDMEKIAVPDSDKGYLESKRLPGDPLVEPRNDLAPLEKLKICMQMAEALADLHGYPGGIIVHQDIQLGQFLWNADKTIVKLNDFNRAEFVLYDEGKGRYCKYLEGKGNGSVSSTEVHDSWYLWPQDLNLKLKMEQWRSPEEYFDKPLTEQIDIFALGNNFIAILTGLWPFPEVEHDDEVQGLVKQMTKPFIDPQWRTTRHIAEAKLAEIIELCYAYKPEERPSIFQLVDLLREAYDEALKVDASPNLDP